MNSVVIFSLLAVLAYFVPVIYFRLVFLGCGVKHNNHQPGQCRVIPGISCGSEKISTTKGGLAFVTSGYKYFTSCDPRNLTGRIYTYDFNNFKAGVTELYILSETIDPRRFSPHGLDIYEDESSELVKLFVVAHINYIESVEVFTFNYSEPNVLRHIDSITDPNFTFINDVAVLGEDSFYVTNSMSSSHNVSFVFAALEFLLEMHTGSVVHYSKKDGGKVVARNIHSANGITFSEGKQFVFVSAHGNATLHVFERDPINNNLRVISTHDTPYSIDNMFYDSNTSLLYGAGSKHLYKLMFGLSTSSFVIRIKQRDHSWQDIEISEIFHDDGHLISSGSTVYQYKHKLLVGSVYDKLAICNVEKLI